MSFSAVSGVSLNLSRLFLRLCRWVLVKMSLNCKTPASSGRFSTSSKMKKVKEPLHGCKCGWKWRFQLFFVFLVVFVGLILVLFFLNFGAMRNMMEILGFCDGKVEFLPENFNVSRKQHDGFASLMSESDQVTSMSCTNEVSKFQNSGFEQCPVRNENIPRSFKRSLFDFKPSSISSHQENMMRTREFVNTAREYCPVISFHMFNVGFWVLVGAAISAMLTWLLAKFSTHSDQKLVQQQKLPSRSAGKWRKKLLYIFVLAGVLVSVWLFWFLYHGNMVWRKETLENMCDERARMLQDQFNVSMNHVHSLAILVSTFHHGKQPSAIDQETFEVYTDRTAFERPLTSGVAYALRVRHSEREKVEKQHGWAIKKMDSEDQSLAQKRDPENLDPSPIQDEYAPVIFSQKTVSHIVSIDMMSGKQDRENILRARESGKGVLTSPFKLLKSNHLGVVLTFAVYNTHLPPDVTPEQRTDATVGYLGACYDVPSLVEKLLHQLASKQTISVNVYDTTKKFAPIKMYGEDEIDTGLLHISSLDFGDPSRSHEMHCRFTQKRPLPWLAIMASGGVLIITLLLGHISRAAINKITTVELECQEMMELKHRAEAADVAKSQFLATVSHEIRTPMNGVLGMLQMLMDTNLDPNQMEYTQTAHDSGQDLISLINEVLDQAKIESGRLELEAVPFDLRTVLDKVLSLFSGKSHEKNLELAVYVSNRVPEVVIGDPGRFRQIITNLVGNSIKFTHNKGHIFVSVHLANEIMCKNMKDEVLKQCVFLDKDLPENSQNTLSGFPAVDRRKSWANFKNLNGPDSTDETDKKIKLLVTVEDTGLGISPEAQDRIFTPFMQADSSMSRKYGGTGIGLSISKRLVDLMGGEIGFVSEPGIGSTFSFTANLIKGETTSLMEQSNFPMISVFRGMRALVVDGNRVRAEVTRYHLQRLGVSMDYAFSLDYAASYLSGFSIAHGSEQLTMVLIDKDVWSNDTSIDFHRLLKELKPKVFLLATSISSAEINDLKSAGLVHNVVTKPLCLRALISCLQETIGIGRKKQVNRQMSNLGNLLKSKHILVVDDNGVNRRVAEGALKKYGAVVTCVDSGKAAVTMLKPPHKFDACFMDLQMPEMDGFQATTQIRSLESKFNERLDSSESSDATSAGVGRWHTPILAMTADVIQATNEKCMNCGMDDYVSKPFDEHQLYSAVARLFESG